MRRMDFTYGQLDKVLRSLGFTGCLVPGDRRHRFTTIKKPGATLWYRRFTKTS